MKEVSTVVRSTETVPKYWEEEEQKKLKSATTFDDLVTIAKSILYRMWQDARAQGKLVVMLCGPISTGGRGSVEENLKFFKEAIAAADEDGYVVFNQTYFQEAMQRMQPAYLLRAGYRRDILTEFYGKIFRSGFISRAYFLPGWTTSRGATWERRTLRNLGISCLRYPKELLEKR